MVNFDRNVLCCSKSSDASCFFPSKRHGNIPNNVNTYVQSNQYIDTPKRTDYKQNLKKFSSLLFWTNTQQHL